jgi:hypothetical protein
MVRHYYEFIQCNLRTDDRRTVPFSRNDLSCVVENHRAVNDSAKQAGSMVNTKSDEVRSRVAVVIVQQSNRPPAATSDLIAHRHGPV